MANNTENQSAAHTPAVPGTPLPFEGTDNFRELGGYRAADGRAVRYGQFYRSGALNPLKSVSDRSLLESLKLKTILDLRSSGESRYEPDPELPGIHQLRISALYYPDGTELDFSPDGIEKLDAAMEEMKKNMGADKAFAQLYTHMPFHNPAFQTLFEKLENGGTPILFHCSAGKDRTGIAAILILLALGVDKETALDDYMLTNVCRRKAIEKSLEKHAALLAEHPEAKAMIMAGEGVCRTFAEQALDAIEKQYGTYEDYFQAEFGLDKTRLKALRDRYLE
ncbi:MAG: tyrosine-protein phosphatase [Lachnospiraceae bacterium]|nr:tyrosine-protein phosphatase [Lachnospiraceae bacterium]